MDSEGNIWLGRNQGACGPSPSPHKLHFNPFNASCFKLLLLKGFSAIVNKRVNSHVLLVVCVLSCPPYPNLYTGWRRKNVANFRMALCDTVIKMNEVKSTCSVSKHFRISLKILA